MNLRAASKTHILPVLFLLGDRCRGIRDFPFQARLSTSQSLDMTFSRALQLEAAKTYLNKAIQRTVLAQKETDYSESGYALLAGFTRRIGISSQWDILAGRTPFVTL